MYLFMAFQVRLHRVCEVPFSKASWKNARQ